MFDLTRQERTVLILLMLITLMGVSLSYAFKINPRLGDLVNFVESDKLYRRIDLNQATYQDLISIPHIGDKIAKRIIDYRDVSGSFKESDELLSIYGIGPSHYKTIKKYIKTSF